MEDTSKKRFFNKLKRAYQKITSKRYSTLAGTLVFFLLLSIIPFIFINTLLLNAFSINYDWLIELGIFNGYRKAILLLIETARNASKGVSLFFILSAIYSSTNFFYHMRRSGEIIYNYTRKKGGALIRLSSAVLVILLLFGLVAASAVFLTFQQMFSSILPSIFLRAAVYAGLAALSYLLIIILNLYICPYRNKFKHTLKGSAFTLVFWFVATLLFGFYAQNFGSMQRLYGAMAFFMVFLFWLYIIMQGLIIGVIFNMRETRIKEEKKY